MTAGPRRPISSPDPRANVRQLMNGDVKLAVFTVGRRYFYTALSRDTPAGVVVS